MRAPGFLFASASSVEVCVLIHIYVAAQSRSSGYELLLNGSSHDIWATLTVRGYSVETGPRLPQQRLLLHVKYRNNGNNSIRKWVHSDMEILNAGLGVRRMKLR